MSCIASTSTFPASTSSFPAPAVTTPPHGASARSETPMDNFLSDIISAVTKDAVCGSCEEGAAAFSKCVDCKELLCDTCVRAHQRVRLTKDHKISRYANIVSPQQLGASAGTSSQEILLWPSSMTTSLTIRGEKRIQETRQYCRISACDSAITSFSGALCKASLSPCQTTLTLCDNHGELQRLFCESCRIATCSECLEEHRGHQFTYMEEALDNARTTNQKLNTETRSAITGIREAIDNVQHMSERVEVRSIQAATEARALMRRYITALEEREVDLLKQIDQSRQIKGKMLSSQMDNLRSALSKLARTSDLLNECVDSTNINELVAANEKAANELKQIRSLRPELVPCEDDGILFMPPDNSLLRAISSIGSVTVSAPLMSSRLLASHVVKESSFLGALSRETNEESESVFMPARNRPIYGATQVVVRNRGPCPSLTFGTEGEEDGQLCRPWGVCCNYLGQIIVGDRSNNRIQIFDSEGRFLLKFGTHGTGPGQFDRPAGVAVSPENNIVVADKDNHRIQIFMMDGTFVRAFGEKGMRSGQFNYPWDVACNSLGHIIVSDTRNHRIQLFSSDGIFLNKYGFEGTTTMWKHFDSPRGVCFTPKGNIIVTDFNNHRLVVVDKGFMNAQFLGQEGAGFKQFLRPQGVVCDDEGNIIVADSRNNRIQVFESNGNFLWKLGQVSKVPGDLDRPSGICLSPEGRIIVVDFGNNRVQIY